MQQRASGLYVPDSTDVPDWTAINPNWDYLDGILDASVTPPQIGLLNAAGTAYGRMAPANHNHQGRFSPLVGGYGFGGVVERRISGTMNTSTPTSVYTCPTGAVAIFAAFVYTSAVSGTMAGYAGTSAINWGSANSTQFLSRTISAAGTQTMWPPPLAAGDQLWLTGPASTNYYIIVFEITTGVADGIVVPKFANAGATTVSLYSPPSGKSARALILYNGSNLITSAHYLSGASAQTFTPMFVNNGAAAIQILAGGAINALTGNPGGLAIPLFGPVVMTSSTDAVQFTLGAAGVNGWGLYQTF